MKRIVVLFVLVLASCAHMSTTRVIDDAECSEAGSFVPGSEAVACDLYDMDGRLLERVEIKVSDKRHCNARGASFLKCVDTQGKPIWPKTATAPLCPFTGDKPSCPQIAPGTPVQVVR